MVDKGKHFWSKTGVSLKQGKILFFPENFLEKNSVLNEKVFELQQKVSPLKKVEREKNNSL